MAFDIHTIDVAAGSNINRLDRVIAFFQNTITSAAGSGAGPVTTAVTFSGELPATYNAFVTPNINATASITNKTSSGFNVVLNPPLASATLAAGTFDVLVIA